jgi:uncharacterized BrkB/YihY/UPF0761 family membrane protein
VVASAFCLLAFALWTVGHWATRVIFEEITYTLPTHSRWRTVAWYLGTVMLMFLALSLVHRFLPVCKRSWRWLSVGNVFSVVSVVLISIGFNLFLRYSPTVPRVYSVLAGFVLLMTWIYMANLVLLVGAELDTTLLDLQDRQ